MMNNEINRNTVLAEPEHIAWLRLRASERTEALLRSEAGASVRNCGDAIFRELFRQLRETAAAVLDYLYYNGEIDGEALLRDGERLIETACPRLMGMIRQREEDFSLALTEALLRVESCRDRIGRLLPNGRPFRKLTGIRFRMGDLHDHGRQTLVFESDEGKFVYKPHSLAADGILRDLSETFFSGLFYVPRTVCGDGFGFCEYIENEPARTWREAELYYRRLGGYCAVCRMLGSVDLHSENLLCRNAVPVPVDLETAFSPAHHLDSGLSPEDELRNALIDSCLLPAPDGDCRYSLLFNASEQNVSAPIIDGERKTADCFMEAFLAGFRETYRSGMAQRDALIAFARKTEDIPVRAVLRSTAGYGKLIKRTRLWKWASDPRLEAEVQRALTAAMINGVEPCAEQIASETAAVLRGDIPYFTVRMDGCDLPVPDGSAGKDRFALSPKEHWLRCMERLGEGEMELHCRLFANAQPK